MNVGILDDVEHVVKLLESCRERCGSCREIDEAIGNLKKIAVDAGILLDYLSHTYSETQRLLAKYASSGADGLYGLVDLLIGDKEAYVDEVAKRLNMQPDRLVSILEALKASGIIDYSLRYEDGVRIVVRRRT